MKEVKLEPEEYVMFMGYMLFDILPKEDNIKEFGGAAFIVSDLDREKAYIINVDCEGTYIMWEFDTSIIETDEEPDWEFKTYDEMYAFFFGEPATESW